MGRQAAATVLETAESSTFDAIVIGAGVAGLYQLISCVNSASGYGRWKPVRRSADLVLEPLPRRPFRFREPHLRLFVFTGAAR